MKLYFLLALFIALFTYVFSKKKQIIRLRPKCQRFLTISSCNLQDYCNWNHYTNECNHINTIAPTVVYRRRPRYLLKRRRYVVRKPLMVRRRTYVH